MRSPRLRAASAAVVLTGLLATGLPAHRATAANDDRAAAVASYNTEFLRYEPVHEWTGDVATCAPGTVSDAYKASVLQRVNWYRGFAGLPPVVYDNSFDAAAAAAALNMSANKRLTHGPTSDSACYSQEALSGASKSNLAGGTSGIAAVDAYMLDYGENNKAVGHRNWILSPTLGSVATGDSLHPSFRANVLTVVTPLVAAATPRDGFIAWPPPGNFPSALTPARWSFSLKGEFSTSSFQNAAVSVSGPEGPVAVSIVHRSGPLVFEPAISKSTTDTQYTVTITNISAAVSSYSYNVTLNPVDAPLAAPSLVPNTLSACSSEGALAAWIQASGSSAALVPAALDNNWFKIGSRNTVLTRTALDPTKESYAVRIQFTATNGASAQQDFTFTTTLGTTEPCAPRDVLVEPGSTTAKVSWTTSTVGAAIDEYLVFTTPSSRFCTTTVPSCVLRNLEPGKKYEVKVVARHRDVEAYASTSFETATAEKAPSTATTKLKAKKRYALAKVMKLPSGSKRYSTSGTCRLSADKRYVTASRRGSCTIAVRTARKSVRKKIMFS